MTHNADGLQILEINRATLAMRNDVINLDTLTKAAWPPDLATPTIAGEHPTSKLWSDIRARTRAPVRLEARHRPPPIGECTNTCNLNTITETTSASSKQR
ncbi:hypothetical protein QP921_02770 [Corynebacterium pseudodiphtheriticum]|nr:hypothetical protein [Corynebacterium pseudodiphtheriticum]